MPATAGVSAAEASRVERAGGGERRAGHVHEEVQREERDDVGVLPRSSTRANATANSRLPTPVASWRAEHEQLRACRPGEARRRSRVDRAAVAVTTSRPRRERRAERRRFGSSTAPRSSSSCSRLMLSAAGDLAGDGGGGHGGRDRVLR